jgi:hypothetical protein
MLTIALLQARIFVVTRNKNYIIYVKMKNLYISLKCHQNILKVFRNISKIENSNKKICIHVVINGKHDLASEYMYTVNMKTI